MLRGYFLIEMTFGNNIVRNAIIHKAGQKPLSDRFANEAACAYGQASGIKEKLTRLRTLNLTLPTMEISENETLIEKKA